MGNLFGQLPSNFQILGVTESGLKDASPSTASIILPRFTYKRMPTKSANGGTLLHIKNDINYKLRPDLNISKDKQLESILIEILPKISKNILFGCIYKPPCMYLKEFVNLFLKPLTGKLNKENNKGIILLGDFNIDLKQTQITMHPNFLI